MEGIWKSESHCYSKYSNDKPPCLICGEPILADASKPPNVEIFKELFRVFCKYMHWKNTEEKAFKFSTEMFPFCQSCRPVLVDVFNLNAQVESILDQLNEITTNVNAKILLSQERLDVDLAMDVKLHNLKEEKPDVKVEAPCFYYNSEKVEYFRGIVLTRYSPLVCLEQDIKGTADLHCKKSSELSSEPEDPGDGLVGESPPGLENDEVETPEISNVKEEWESIEMEVKEDETPSRPKSGTESYSDFEWKGRLKDQIRKIGHNMFLYDDKYQFQKYEKGWICSTCLRRFIRSWDLEVHLLMGCRGDKIVQENEKPKAPEVGSLPFNPTLTAKFKEIGPTAYTCHEKHTIELRIDGKCRTWVCCMCQKEFNRVKDLEKRVLTGCPAEVMHPNEVVEIDSTHFEFKGFGFHLDEKRNYKCDHCYYESRQKYRLVGHMQIHIRQLAIENLTNNLPSK